MGSALQKKMHQLPAQNKYNPVSLRNLFAKNNHLFACRYNRTCNIGPAKRGPLRGHQRIPSPMGEMSLSCHYQRCQDRNSEDLTLERHCFQALCSKELDLETLDLSTSEDQDSAQCFWEYLSLSWKVWILHYSLLNTPLFMYP